MENCCIKVLFCDREPVWRIVPGSYCFVMQSLCRVQLQDGIVFDIEPVWRNVAGRYSYVIWSHCG